jgi:hypothetical protein
LHHDIIEDGAKDTSHHLGGKGCFRGQLALLSQLEISKEIFSLLNSIESEDCEIHVCFSQLVYEVKNLG